MKKINFQKTVLRPLALVCVGMSLVACAVNETATVVVDGSEATEIIETNSGILSDSLRITNTKIGYAGNLMKAQVTITNDSSDDLDFRYKFKWLDKDDFEIAVDGRPWTPMLITPFESKSVQAVAPNPSASSFKILLQN